MEKAATSIGLRHCEPSMAGMRMGTYYKGDKIEENTNLQRGKAVSKARNDLGRRLKDGDTLGDTKILKVKKWRSKTKQKIKCYLKVRTHDAS